ncbi:BamA/TamA family outer membrane protein [Robertkochia aurantiaca]|uniref:BamA/TamA family outer membrane protein n=1 Tax=Robertkochia aurantiaca TaxID=2873700 RepID=UPI001CCB4FF2|nr:BamA/TamA family outer membrane protein [Robertkochia sp. 3YJGBD-33]
MRLTQFSPFLIFFLLTACASYEVQYREEAYELYPEDRTLHKRFYLLGDAGNSPAGEPSRAIKAWSDAMAEGKADDFALYLGDNIYPNGLPKKEDPDYELAAHRLQVQVEAAARFPGRSVFIPGNHDWYSGGIKGLQRQEDFIEDRLDLKHGFLPSDACGLDEVDIDDQTHIIIIDSQLFLEDWDDHPTINDDCEIKTRRQFFIELETMLKKAEGKTVLIAIHHPLYSYGPHGGYYAAEKHLFPFQKKIPLPGLGSLITITRKSGGISIQDIQNEKYREFTTRIKSIVKEAPARVIFVSGHEHSLQYTESENFRQVVSGSGSKISATKLTGDAVFTYGNQGYAVLDVFTDGSSWIRYYDAEKPGEPVFQTEVFPPRIAYREPVFPAEYPREIESSVYEPGEIDVSNLYAGVWGDHYRELYGRKIKAKVALLDTLYGGLTPIRMGGGHQTKTLRLVDSEGREFNMRGLKKSGAQFLQTVVLKDKVLEQEDLTGTLPEEFLQDFYTTAHPYAAYPITVLAKAAGVFHTHPQLYYIPKQPALGKYNELYGDELYMIEERPADEHNNNPGFGYANDIDSTDDLFADLREDEENRLDENAYVRARLFDMLIGDWDRHTDQWRWAKFEEGELDIYRPVPRDRDQAFSDFDGAFLSSIRTLVAPARMMQRYEPELKNLEWFNTEPLPMDRVLIQNARLEDFIREAKHLQNTLTEEVIDSAFREMPLEVQDESMEEIKKTLIGRKALLQEIAENYYDILNQTVVLRGTDKDDYIDVKRLEDGFTRVEIYRNKDGERADLLLDKTFDPEQTEEIWIYGLDDTDTFTVTGDYKSKILVRLIGGQNNDSYDIENGHRLRFYDHKSKKNTIIRNDGGTKRFTDIYENNLFTFSKNKYSTNMLLPGIGFNPDAGVIAGVNYNITSYGFERNPFTSSHDIGLKYHFATEGVEVQYQGEFAGWFKSSNLWVGARYNSPTFAHNFFGLGTESENPDEELGLDYNRVNLSNMSLETGIVRRSDYGNDMRALLRFEGVKVDETEGRFITTFSDDPEFYDWKYFMSLEFGFLYESYDRDINPSRGMRFDIETGYTRNLKNGSKDFAYLKPELLYYSRLTSDKKLVLKTGVASHLNFGNGFEFYQGAFLGGNNGLRGYRINRFTGKHSLVFNGDLRYNFREYRTRLLPMQPGIYLGYDYGRVWASGDPENSWHDSIGGGIYVAASNLIYLDVSFFNSDEGNRFAFGFGISF